MGACPQHQGEPQMTYQASYPVEILSLFGYLSRKKNKGYCLPSQRKICSILCDVYGVDRSIRTLNRYLRHLCDEGLLVRRRRHEKAIDGSLILRTTLYYLTKKAFKVLSRVMVRLRLCGVFVRRRVRLLKECDPRVPGGRRYNSNDEARSWEAVRVCT